MPSSITMLVRPRIGIQFGVLPHHAVILPLPDHVAVGHVTQVLSMARQPIDVADLVRGLGHCGLDSQFSEEAVDELRRARILMPHQHHSTPIYILNTGAGAKRTAEALERKSIPHRIIDDPAVAGSSLVLTGGEIFLPGDVHYALMTHRIAHFPHGVLDGQLVMGPLVVPGETACLNCYDAHYARLDGHWASLRVQASAKPSHRDRHDLEFASHAVATLVRDQLLPWSRERRKAHRFGQGTALPAVPATVTARRIITLGTFDILEESVSEEQRRECPACIIAKMDGAVRRVRQQTTAAS